MQSDTYMEIEARRAEIIDKFIQYPQFSEYFYDRNSTKSVQTLRDRDEQARLYALCELFLTHFSMIVRIGSQANFKPAVVWDPHRRTISRFFERSETLRSYYAKNKDCFHTELASFLPD